MHLAVGFGMRCQARGAPCGQPTQASRNNAARPKLASQMCKLFPNEPLMPCRREKADAAQNVRETPNALSQCAGYIKGLADELLLATRGAEETRRAITTQTNIPQRYFFVKALATPALFLWPFGPSPALLQSHEGP
ncbi:hypothetical protein Bpro_0227 [Polaromonas sp. JS666]|nr:hypothetical protein Bpro_0227 [Polaromonas sp. JS666]